MLAAEHGGIAAVVLVVMGQNDAARAFFLKQSPYRSGHVVLGSIDDQPVNHIHINRHQWRANRTVPQLDHFYVAKKVAINNVHTDRDRPPFPECEIEIANV